MPITSRENQQQIIVGHPLNSARPTDEIADSGERIGTVMVIAYDTDPGLVQRQPGDPARLSRPCHRTKLVKDNKEGND